MITKEKAIEELKRMGNYFRHQGEGNSNGAITLNHIIGFIINEEYDDTFAKLKYSKISLKYLMSEDSKSWDIKNEGEIKYNEKINKIISEISLLEAHITKVNNETVANIKDKSHLFRVKKHCYENCHNIEFEENRIINIESIEFDEKTHWLILKNVSFINFFDYVTGKELKRCEFFTYKPFQLFNEYFEKL